MKKYLLALILILSCNALANHHVLNADNIVTIPDSPCTVPANAVRDRELDCLHGDVHMVKTEAAVFIKKEDHYIKVAVSQTRINTYDTLGNKTEEQIYGSKDYGTESQFQRIVYSFNTTGFATGVISYSRDYPTPIKSVYTLDDQGNRIKETTYGPDGKISNIISLMYDSAGHNIEKRYDYISSIYQRSHEVYEYNGNNLIQNTNYNKDGSINYKEVFTYKNGHRIEAGRYLLNVHGQFVRSGKNHFQIRRERQCD